MSIRELDSFSAEEKCQRFDAIYEQARDFYDRAIKNGADADNDDHYVFEKAMACSLGVDEKSFWDHYNRVVQ